MSRNHSGFAQSDARQVTGNNKIKTYNKISYDDVILLAKQRKMVSIQIDINFTSIKGHFYRCDLDGWQMSAII